jgi:predicted kinase
VLLVVTGLPASGKTTLSIELATRLGLPLIAKDRYKEILFETLGVGDRAWSRRLGQAAIALQYDAMSTIRDAVVDSALWTGLSEPQLTRVGRPFVQVFCDCPFALARDRYLQRIRHDGFMAEKMTADDYEQFRPLSEPLRVEAPLIRVDTEREVDYEAVLRDLSLRAPGISQRQPAESSTIGRESFDPATPARPGPRIRR